MDAASVQHPSASEAFATLRALIQKKHVQSRERANGFNRAVGVPESAETAHRTEAFLSTYVPAAADFSRFMAEFVRGRWDAPVPLFRVVRAVILGAGSVWEAGLRWVAEEDADRTGWTAEDWYARMVVHALLALDLPGCLEFEHDEWPPRIDGRPAVVTLESAAWVADMDFDGRLWLLYHAVLHLHLEVRRVLWLAMPWYKRLAYSAMGYGWADDVPYFRGV